MKKRLLCPQLPKPGLSVPLSDDEAHHAIRVLRLRDGDVVEALDGKGNKALVTLRTRGGLTRFEAIQNSDSLTHDVLKPTESSLPIVLEMAVLKGEAMEWVVEKAVELGIEKLVPVLTAFTVVQVKSKGPEYFQERWQKIADQSLKQCGRLSRMIVAPPQPLESLLAKGETGIEVPRLWCDEKGIGESTYIAHWIQQNISRENRSVKLLIGPEGGWSPSERELLSRESLHKAIHRVELGPLILRAETAAVFTMSLLSAQVRTSNQSQNMLGSL